MFTKKHPKSIAKDASPTAALKNLEKDFESMKPLSISLGGNRLNFVDGKRWVYDSSDLDMMAQEIVSLENENMHLNSALKAEVDKNDILRQNLVQVNTLKSVTLDMLTEERARTAILEQELAAYKEELNLSYGVILQLRKVVEGEGDYADSDATNVRRNRGTDEDKGSK